MQQTTKSRVTVDFPLPERDILQLLCDVDYRPPQEQIRWLVIDAAKQRGLITVENKKPLAATLPERTANGFVSINPSQAQAQES